MADDQEETGKQQRVFGPLPSKAAPGPAIDYDKLAAAVAAKMSAPAPAPVAVEQDIPEEDRAIVAAVSAAHPSARAIQVTNRLDVRNLSAVEVDYYLTTGGAQHTAFLVYDDGSTVFLFRAL